MAVTAPTPRVLADVLPRSIARDVVLVVAGAAFVGLAAQISFPLPFTPVPVTGQTFAVLLVGASLGSIRGLLSMVLYMLMGMAGVPWFSDGASGFGGPTFGYIIGFIVAAWLVGFLAERNWTRTVLDTALAMILGSVVIYAIGVTWLKFSLPGLTWAGAVEAGMSPFLFLDLVKVILAAGLFPLVWKLLTRAGLAPREATEDATTQANIATTQATVDADSGSPVSGQAGAAVAAESADAVRPADVDADPTRQPRPYD